MNTGELVTRFPAPPQWVRHALEKLREAELLGTGPAPLRLHDRPWDPPTCSPHVRSELWPWLDAVAAWVNRGYAWQTAHAIPSCWPAHPPLVRELAVLACLRTAAADATAPQALEEWHRYALPGFFQRMSARSGIGCTPGRHVDWPARAWDVEFTSPSAVDARKRMFQCDIGDLASTARPAHDPDWGFDDGAVGE
jgi:hypothetical protein